MKTSDIQKQVISFVAKETGTPEQRLSLNSRLLQDLGVDGDDAYELVVHFSEVFGVDISHLDWARHFNSEWGVPFYILKEAFYRLIGLKVNLDPITIQDLVIAAEDGNFHLSSHCHQNTQ